jgi:eukaryotic-like serine/threonine-protein kinase
MTEPRFLGGRYELGEVLGHGGMAEVRIGIDRRLGRTVAVKVLRPDLATDPTFQARFRREAQSAASLNHPSIVAVYDTGEEILDNVNVPYIVMEYVEGRTLRDVLREGRRILPERALEITAEVLEALEYSHRAGIVHRDIKPGNVMLTPSGDVKVMDFGIARAVADASATMTQTAAVIGTAQYLSPEQARGESVDARSDIYSTGCLLYELLTGRPPFVGDSPVSVAYQHVREEPRPPSMLDPEVSPEADAITLKALSKKPIDRYQSAEEMRQDIVRCLAGQRVIAPVYQGDATQRFMPAGGPPMGPPMEEAWGYDDQQQPEEKDKGRRVAYILLAIAVAFVLGVAAFIGFQTLGGPDLKAVPTVTGMTESEAKARIEQEGFVFGEPEHKPNDTVPKGQVSAQSPSANTKLEEGKTITVTISDGKPSVKVPGGLVGSQVSEAEVTLRGAGLKTETEEDRDSDKPAGEVIATDPEEGSDVAEGATVKLTISAGLAQVPDVRQTKEEKAEQTLKEAGFKVKKDFKPTSDEDPGIVMEQDPQGEAYAKQGSTVTITIAQEETHPDLTVRAAAGGEVPSIGGSTQLSVNVSNDGEGDSGQASVTINLPQNASTTGQLPDGCDSNGSTVTCTVDKISAGDTESFDITVVLPPGTPGTSVQGTVTVQTDGDESQGNNSAGYAITYQDF